VSRAEELAKKQAVKAAKAEAAKKEKSGFKVGHGLHLCSHKAACSCGPVLHGGATAYATVFVVLFASNAAGP
jgi:hypothetical protein